MLAEVDEFKRFPTPMSDFLHPELDLSEELRPKEHHLYRAIIGSLNWMVTLGRLDIAYATNTLARFSMAPRIGHLKAAFRVLGYLRSYQSDNILIDPRPFDYSILEKESNDFQMYWKEFYPDAVEEIPFNRPGTTSDDPSEASKLHKVQLSVYVDADHAHNQLTRRSVTGIILFINQTPVRWISKRQNTVETSTYGSEMVAARVATDLIIEYRYILRMLGFELDGPSWMFGVDKSILACET